MSFEIGDKVMLDSGVAGTLAGPVEPKFKEGDWVLVAGSFSGFAGIKGRVERVMDDGGFAVKLHPSGSSLRFFDSELEATSCPVPKPGEWVRATTADGKVHEFLVERDELNWSGNRMLAPMPDMDPFFFVVPGKSSRQAPIDFATVVDWGYIEPPHNDTVKPGELPTVSGVYETFPRGRRVYLYANSTEHMTKARMLVWADDVE